MSRIPTLDDVAKLSGVSTATISRYINSPDKVAEKTGKIVMDAIEKLGYTPNYSAKSLVGKFSNTVGAVIPTMENAIFAQGLQAFQEELNMNGITLFVSSSLYLPAREDSQIKDLVSRGVDGILLIGKHRSKSIYDYLIQRETPFVIAWSFTSDNDILSVGFSNFNSMGEMAEKVISLGHKNLGYITADLKNNDRARERLDGLKNKMKEKGLNPNDLKIAETIYNIHEGGEAFRRLIMTNPKVTAVLCGNDVLAVGAIKMAKRMNYKIPGDISITGFDDIELATVVDPGLTTVHVPHRKMGVEAAKILMEKKAHPEMQKSILLNTYIVMRESLGPAPGS